MVQVNTAALATVRTLAGLTQSELARRIGCTPAFVSRIESGHKKPSPDRLRDIAAALGVPLASIITEPTDDMLEEARFTVSGGAA